MENFSLIPAVVKPTRNHFNLRIFEKTKFFVFFFNFFFIMTKFLVTQSNQFDTSFDGIMLLYFLFPKKISHLF